MMDRSLLISASAISKLFGCLHELKFIFVLALFDCLPGFPSASKYANHVIGVLLLIINLATPLKLAYYIVL